MKLVCTQSSINRNNVRSKITKHKKEITNIRILWKELTFFSDFLLVFSSTIILK